MKKHRLSRLRTCLGWLILPVGLTAVTLLITLFAPPTAAAPDIPNVELVDAFPNLSDGFRQPTAITHAGDGRLFITERQGVIRVAAPGPATTTAPIFLDISDRVSDDAPEKGLLGLAFHPNYAENGFFYVNYTHNEVSRISRFQVTAVADQADPNSETILLEVGQPYANHNGGDLNFGPDRYLYVALGDGGSGGDPGNRAQDRGDLLGKILRLDVDGGGLPPDCDPDGSYTIPADNPFVNGDGCDEVWAYGLRNPWRFSFDRATGDMYIGDVGQNEWEEIDFQPAAGSGGENYGWRCYEGTHAFNLDGCSPDSQDYVFPIHEYSHDSGCSVTGGFVYRGSRYPFLYGFYLYADYCVSELRGLTPNGRVDQRLTAAPGSGIAAFGEDNRGELYLAQSIRDGRVYHITETTPTTNIYLPLILSQTQNE